jgi:dTDP-4-amino-4,6-dideoxygalactose transaminase
MGDEPALMSHVPVNGSCATVKLPLPPSRDRFLVFGSPSLGAEEIEEGLDSLRSSWLGTGPKVARFDGIFRSCKGSPHAVAVSLCTAARYPSVLAAGLQPGDEVTTTSLTLCATVNAIIWTAFARSRRSTISR